MLRCAIADLDGDATRSWVGDYGGNDGDDDSVPPSNDLLATLLLAIRAGQTLAWAVRYAPVGGDAVRIAWARSANTDLMYFALLATGREARALPLCGCVARRCRACNAVLRVYRDLPSLAELTEACRG